MFRYVFAVVSCVLAFAAGPALGATCTVAPGDYVDAAPGDDVTAPAYVIEASGDPCYVTVRILTLPGQFFDGSTPAYYEEYLAPLAGPPPYEKPFGCPYAPGDKVDLRDQYGTWYPGQVTGSDRYCGYDAQYWMDNQWKPFGAIDADLRAATLPMPTPEEIKRIEQKTLELQECPLGGKAIDYAADDVKHGIATEIAERLTTSSVVFEKILAGESVIATDGSIYQSRYPDAARGTTIYAYRVEVGICEPGVPTAATARFSLDYSCYADRFGLFVCRRDAARPLE